MTEWEQNGKEAYFHAISQNKKEITMSVSTMMPNGPLEVPTWGASLELLTRISLLEQRLAGVEKHSTADTYGIVRLSDAEYVTNSDGLALPASEKNAAVEETLGNKLSTLISNLSPERHDFKASDIKKWNAFSRYILCEILRMVMSI